VLGYPDPKLPFILDTDASTDGWWSLVPGYGNCGRKADDPVKDKQPSLLVCCVSKTHKKNYIGDTSPYTQRSYADCGPDKTTMVLAWHDVRS